MVTNEVICDKASDPCFLCGLWICRSAPADARLAAISGTYASANMAWQGARCGVYRRTRGHDEGAEPGAPPRFLCWQGLAGYEDSFFGERKKYGGWGSRVSGGGGGYWVVYM